MNEWIKRNSKQLVKCSICEKEFFQSKDRVPGYGKCDDCFWEIFDAQQSMANEWAKLQEEIEKGK